MLKICLKALCRFAALRPVCFYCVFMTSEQRECKIIWQVFGRWWGFKGQEQGIGWDTFWQWSHRACIMCREKEGKKKKTASDLNFLHTDAISPPWIFRSPDTNADIFWPCLFMLHANLYKCKHFFPLHALLLEFVSFFRVGEVLPWNT